MRRLLLFLSLALPATATNYVFTANNVEMHVGDPVPPLIFNVPGYPGTYISNFTGQPTLTTTATSASPQGTYPISIATGTLALVKPTDSATLVAGTLTIIPPNGIGAHLVNDLAVPSGWTSATEYPMINVKSNSIDNLAGDCSTDDSSALQHLMAFGRLTAHANANTNGTLVTSTGGVSFIGLAPGSIIDIAGYYMHIDHVTDATHLTLTAPVPINHNGVVIRTDGNHVNVDSNHTTVTSLDGPTFIGTGFNNTIVIDGFRYGVQSVTDATHLELEIPAAPQLPAPAASNVWAFVGNPGAAFGRLMRQLYFPAGCYLINRPLQVYGNYWNWKGVGPQQSIIKLAHDTPFFNLGVKQLFLNVPGVNSNQQFDEFIYDMGFEIAPGNPWAEAVNWRASNVGAIRNVQIWADDTRSLFGVGLEGSFPGPTLLKNVAVYGFQYGFQLQGSNEYLTTLENVTTMSQTVGGFGQTQQKVAVRHWWHFGPAQAWSGAQGLSSNTLLDSEIDYDGTLTTVAGIINGAGGYFFGKNVACSGFVPCEFDNTSQTTYNTLPAEWWTGPAQTIFSQRHSPSSIPMTVNETPENPDPCTISTCDWQKLSSTPSTWPAEIASPTSQAIYAPPGAYDGQGNTSITVPDSVNYLDFGNSQYTIPTNGGHMTINVAGSSTTPLIITHCLWENCYVHHTGSRDVAIIDTANFYLGAATAGSVYLEDDAQGGYACGNAQCDGATYYPGQHIWGRQVDFENGDANTSCSFCDPSKFPKFMAHGAIMWFLGYKTEQDSPSVIADQGAKINIFGFFYYQLHILPPALTPDRASVYLNNADFFETGWLFQTLAGSQMPRIVNETQGISFGFLPTPGGNTSPSQALSMFYSFGASDYHFNLTGAQPYFKAKIY